MKSKNLIIILSIILFLQVYLLLFAQYKGGIGDGYSSVPLVSNPPPQVLYAQYKGGIGDGYSLGTSVSNPPPQVLYAQYKGGIGGGYSFGTSVSNTPLPVRLSSFNAIVILRDVKLTWVTQTEINNIGFEVQRRLTKDKTFMDWKVLIFINSHGNTATEQTYTYTDQRLMTGKYQYRLKQTDFNGHYEYFYLNTEVVIGTPLGFFVSQNYPNPANPTSRIDYQLPITAKVKIKIYDVLGKEISSIVYEQKEAGYYTEILDGRNLSSGLYFYRISIEGEMEKFERTFKFVLIK